MEMLENYTFILQESQSTGFVFYSFKIFVSLIIEYICNIAFCATSTFVSVLLYYIFQLAHFNLPCYWASRLYQLDFLSLSCLSNYIQPWLSWSVQLTKILTKQFFKHYFPVTASIVTFSLNNTFF